jgi:hypothetical protein
MEGGRQAGFGDKTGALEEQMEGGRQAGVGDKTGALEEQMEAGRQTGERGGKITGVGV